MHGIDDGRHRSYGVCMEVFFPNVFLLSLLYSFTRWTPIHRTRLVHQPPPPHGVQCYSCLSAPSALLFKRAVLHPQGHLICTSQPHLYCPSLCSGKPTMLERIIHRDWATIVFVIETTLPVVLYQSRSSQSVPFAEDRP
jgi:hypothetical protein